MTWTVRVVIPAQTGQGSPGAAHNGAVPHMTVGLLHPGEMGAAVGACLAGRGLPVLWASTGRSQASAARAASAGLRDVGSVADVAGQADVILSICPPHAALTVARSVTGTPGQTHRPPTPSFAGLYVEANAVSPATAREVAGIIEARGAIYVDGGIIGPPPTTAGDTRLYLSGARAPQIAEMFAGTALDAQVISDQPGQASALKMAYAAWTKGTAALILAIRALARAEGVEEALLAEWQRSQPALPARSVTAAHSAAEKGWRWTAEMEEIAATMAAAGLPGGFHHAAAEIFSRLPRASSPPADKHTLAAVADALRTGETSQS
jgi:3-hydroxyisobutyrate dehydrogenase-like beta-hydroxyacid dehydrogenase